MPPDTARYGRGRSRRDKVFGSGSESAHFGQLLFLASPITLIRGDRRTGDLPRRRTHAERPTCDRRQAPRIWTQVGRTVDARRVSGRGIYLSQSSNSQPLRLPC